MCDVIPIWDTEVEAGAIAAPLLYFNKQTVKNKYKYH